MRLVGLVAAITLGGVLLLAVMSRRPSAPRPMSAGGSIDSDRHLDSRDRSPPASALDSSDPPASRNQASGPPTTAIDGDDARLLELLDRLRALDREEQDFRFFPNAADIAREIAEHVRRVEAPNDVLLMERAAGTDEGLRVRSTIVFACASSGLTRFESWLIQLLANSRVPRDLRGAAILGWASQPHTDAAPAFDLHDFVATGFRDWITFPVRFPRAPLPAAQRAALMAIVQGREDLMLKELALLTVGRGIDEDRDLQEFLFPIVRASGGNPDNLGLASLFVLTRCTDAAIRRRLLDFVNSSTDGLAQTVRFQTLLELGKVSDAPEVIESMKRAVSDPKMSPLMRGSLIFLLGSKVGKDSQDDDLARRDILDQLASIAVNDPKKHARLAAVATLTSKPSDEALALAQGVLLGDRDAELRRSAARFVAGAAVDKRDAMSVLQRAFESEQDLSVKSAILRQVVLLDDPASKAFILSAIQSDSTGQLQGAVTGAYQKLYSK